MICFLWFWKKLCYSIISFERKISKLKSIQRQSKGTVLNRVILWIIDTFHGNFNIFSLSFQEKFLIIIGISSNFKTDEANYIRNKIDGHKTPKLLKS
jgi:hypothetical protein